MKRIAVLKLGGELIENEQRLKAMGKAIKAKRSAALTPSRCAALAKQQPNIRKELNTSSWVWPFQPRSSWTVRKEPSRASVNQEPGPVR